MKSAVYLVLVVAVLCPVPGDPQFTDNVPFFQQGPLAYPQQNKYYVCGLHTSGWSDWIPGSCSQCGQARFRYCQGTSNGCGDWYCLGNRIDYCHNSCPELEMPDPRVIAPNRGSYNCGARVVFSCPECYRLQGDRQMECTPNGTWAGRPPTCQFVSCTQPYKITNGYRRWGTNCNSQAIYKCFSGYELIGPDTQTCSAEGRWIPPTIPLCIPKKCPYLPRPEHGFLIQLSRTYRARAYFRCRMGYELRGSRSIRCSSAGSWSPAPPTCVRIRY